MPRGKAQEDRNEGEGTKAGKDGKKRSVRKMLFILVLILLLSLGGAFLALRLDAFGGFLGARSQREPLPKEPEFTYPVPEIIVNLAGNARQRFLTVKFYLGFDEPKLEQEIERRMPEIRDAVLSILWDKDADILGTPEGKDILKAEIFQTVNGVLSSGKIREVYFWHVMIQ